MQDPRNAFILALVLTSCAEANTDKLTDTYSTDLTAAVGLIDQHAAAVRNASDLGDVSSLEAKLATDWSEVDDDLANAMGEIEDDCRIDEASQKTLDEHKANLVQLRQHIDDHVAAHESHATLEDCKDEEETLQGQTVDRLQTMGDDCEQLREQLRCRNRDRDQAGQN